MDERTDGARARWPLPRPRLRHRALYAAFDRFPAPKGAAVHIGHMASTLFDSAGGGLLYTLGDATLPAYQREGEVEIVRFGWPEPNRLRRALAFQGHLAALVNSQAATLRLAHFREPWAGRPLVDAPGRRWVTVYEVNGLPSVELPAVYPDLPTTTLAKLRADEVRCWTAADAIVTPSATIRDNLVRLGAAAEKIVVIPNGAIPAPAAPRPAPAPTRYLLYFGALQPWQGLDVLLRAFALLADIEDLSLVICAAAPPRAARGYQRLAERLGLATRIQWHFQLTEAALAPWRSHALLSVAPLTESPRNLAQGCCPLKILESMAAGVPVVASDLPAVREIMTDGVHGRLVRPDRPSHLARAIRVLLEYPAQRAALGEAARRRIADGLTWRHATERLTGLYQRLCPDLLRADGV